MTRTLLLLLTLATSIMVTQAQVVSTTETNNNPVAETTLLPPGGGTTPSLTSATSQPTQPTSSLNSTLAELVGDSGEKTTITATSSSETASNVTLSTTSLSSLVVPTTLSVGARNGTVDDGDGDLSEDIDVDAGNTTSSVLANNVTVSDEELLGNEDEVMVSELDAPVNNGSAEANDTFDVNAEVNAFAEANDTLEINAEVTSPAEVNTEPTEGNDNTEGFSTFEAFDRVEANHTAEALDTSVLADDIIETDDIPDEAELNSTEAAEESVNSSTSSELSLLVLDNGAGDKTLSTSVQKAGMLDLQTQLYILSATFGAVIFLLILLVLVLALSVARIKEQLHERLSREDRGCLNNSRDAIGYENGGFSSSGNGHANSVNERSVDGDDLERLGYTQYRGGNRENVYKVTDPVHGEEGEIPLNEMRNSSGAGGGKPMMKYEEGVVPLGDRDPEMNSNYSYR